MGWGVRQCDGRGAAGRGHPGRALGNGGRSWLWGGRVGVCGPGLVCCGGQSMVGVATQGDGRAPQDPRLEDQGGPGSLRGSARGAQGL